MIFPNIASLLPGAASGGTAHLDQNPNPTPLFLKGIILPLPKEASRHQEDHFSDPHPVNLANCVQAHPLHPCFAWFSIPSAGKAARFLYRIRVGSFTTPCGQDARAPGEGPTRSEGFHPQRV